MNYELAKQLKEAGFAQKTHYNEFESRIDHFGPSGEEIANPSLEELIEAVTAIGHSFMVGHWEAKKGTPVALWRSGIRHDGAWVYSMGSNPTEAVAKLWLALQAKH